MLIMHILLSPTTVLGSWPHVSIALLPSSGFLIKKRVCSMENLRRSSLINLFFIVLLVVATLTLCYLSYKALQPQRPKSLSDVHLAVDYPEGGIIC